MEIERLKQAEIKEGKIYLEGRVIDADLLKLCIIEGAHENPKDPEKTKYIIEEISEKKPEGADAYIFGGFINLPSASWVGTDYYPILYLKIKTE